MNKTLHSFIAIATLSVFQACTTMESTTTRKTTGPTAYFTEQPIIAMPVIADLLIEDRFVIGTFNENKVTEEYAKNMAVLNAVRNAKADVLVEPRFDITIQDQTITVEVKGHPARYKNFRTPKAPEEMNGKKPMETTKPNENYSPPEKPKTKGK